MGKVNKQKRLAASKLILLLAASLLQPQNALTVLSLWIPSQPTAAATRATSSLKMDFSL